jgi:poly(A) polymerase Pap1
MAPDLEHEAAFIRAFIAPTKRERLVELLGKPKRRRDVLSTLYHFADLDPRFIRSISAAEDSAEGIEALLRSKGAPDLCYGSRRLGVFR